MAIGQALHQLSHERFNMIFIKMNQTRFQQSHQVMVHVLKYQVKCTQEKKGQEKQREKLIYQQSKALLLPTFESWKYYLPTVYIFCSIYSCTSCPITAVKYTAVKCFHKIAFPCNQLYESNVCENKYNATTRCFNLDGHILSLWCSISIHFKEKLTGLILPIKSLGRYLETKCVHHQFICHDLVTDFFKLSEWNWVRNKPALLRLKISIREDKMRKQN